MIYDIGSGKPPGDSARRNRRRMLSAINTVAGIIAMFAALASTLLAYKSYEHDLASNPIPTVSAAAPSPKTPSPATQADRTETIPKPTTTSTAIPNEKTISTLRERVDGFVSTLSLWAWLLAAFCVFVLTSLGSSRTGLKSALFWTGGLMWPGVLLWIWHWQALLLFVPIVIIGSFVGAGDNRTPEQPQAPDQAANSPYGQGY